MEGLQQCSANYVPLSPISFIEGAAFFYGDKQVSIVYGSTTYSWRETHQRCLKLASALSQLGVKPGDVVAAVAPNIPALYELHFGVPMAGAVLSPLNPRLDPPTLASIFEQLEPKIIFMDYQFVEVVLKALDHHLLPQKSNPPFLIIIPEYNRNTSSSTIQLSQGSSLDYNDLLSTGKTDFQPIRPSDECLPISVNYTSGSTGKPKGVVYSHRAAYLNSLAQIFRSDMRSTPVFLWTVDMFRCNGWCFTWAVAALGGTNVCIRNVTAQVIFDSISLHKVTHICGAPAILNTIAEPENRGQIPHQVAVIVAGVLPAPQIIDKIMELGFNFCHGYGMTEALGPVCVKSMLRKADNNHRNLEGIHNIMGEGVDVKDPKTMMSVAADGKTVGEVMLRSNTMMSGYLKNLEATQKAFSGGWYRTGDLGVRCPDGCIQMKDRRADAISCGGETISSLEVEAVIASHPMVLEVAVVARADDVLGATPCAFVHLKEGWSQSAATADEIIRFCGDKLPHFATPKSVVFRDLPVNSTGKIQKFVLREEANAMGSLPSTNGH